MLARARPRFLPSRLIQPMLNHHIRSSSPALVLCCSILLLFPAVFLQNQQLERVDAAAPRQFSSAITGAIPLSNNQQNYSNSGSWAVGVVVPQNSLTDNGKVEWQNVGNVTAVFRVPIVSSTDYPIYIVMSLMTSNGAIIQVAAGLYQNMSTWGTDGMEIIHPSSYPLEYNSVVDSADPQISAGQLASMSLYVSENQLEPEISRPQFKQIYQRFVRVRSSASPFSQNWRPICHRPRILHIEQRNL